MDMSQAGSFTPPPLYPPATTSTGQQSLGDIQLNFGALAIRSKLEPATQPPNLLPVSFKPASWSRSAEPTFQPERRDQHKPKKVTWKAGHAQRRAAKRERRREINEELRASSIALRKERRTSHADTRRKIKEELRADTREREAGVATRRILEAAFQFPSYRDSELRELLELPNNQGFIIFLPVVYALNKGKIKRKDVENIRKLMFSRFFGKMVETGELTLGESNRCQIRAISKARGLEVQVAWKHAMETMKFEGIPEEMDHGKNINGK